MSALLSATSTRLARYLARPTHVHGAAPPTPTDALRAVLRPGDVLLVEGDSRFATAIKYLTQSTWSHAALYVGVHAHQSRGAMKHAFVEADVVDGVRMVDVETFAGYHTRICRPVGLDDDGCRRVAGYAIDRIGMRYDLRNIIDLVRYLLPTPPVPIAWRRRMLAFGGGDPTRAICSTLIALAFQSIRYPILPVTRRHDPASPECPGCFEERLHIRHHRLFAPRDFDVSPYFQIVKPTIAAGFDYRALAWDEPTSTA
jgi:hypothetical protein